MAAFALSAPAVLAEPIAIADVKHDGEVNFEKEILPIFRRNCLACHSATEAQSDLVLETPQTLLKGGSEGPAVVAGKSAESLLLALAARQKEPHMPPADNDVSAKSLTPEELGLIKLWIDQGAKGDVSSAPAQITWQPLPPGIHPVYAVAITPDGQYAAASRANQVFLYHVPSRRELGRLTDPSLIEKGIYKQPGVADLDLIQSLAFSPDGQYLASGGFRTVKLWQRPTSGKKLDLAGLEGPARSIAVSSDGKFAAIGEETGKVKVFDLTSGQVTKNLQGHTGPATGVAFTADGTKLVSAAQDKTFRVWNLADGAQIVSVETPAPINGVAIVGDGSQLVTAGADNLLRLWALPTAAPAEGAEPPKPLKDIGGHGGPINSVQIVATTPTKVVTGCQDGGIRLIDTASGGVERQYNLGAPVVAAAMRADGKRVAAAGANNLAKLWDAENGQELATLKGDLRLALKAESAARTTSLAKKHVELTKNDFEEAKKRKTAEEENQKKSMEALTKADAEFKQKDEALKKPTEEKVAAEKALADATAAKTKADETKKANDEAFTKADEALKVAKTNQDAANKAATDSAAVAKAAADKLVQAKDAAGKDPNNQGLKDAQAAAEKESTDAEAKKKTADEAKVVADKAFADADAARKTAETNKQASDKAATDSMTAMTQADQKLKQVLPPFEKATEERTTAERTLETSKRGVERAAEAVKKATDALPGVEAIAKQMEEAAKQREAEQAAALAASQQSEKPLKAIAFSPDGTRLITVGDDQLVHTWDGQTGAAIDVLEGAAAVVNVVAFTAGGQAVTAAANNAGALWDFATEWKLVKTIGSPDAADTLVDRVTALDFSPDGKLLAVGGGEPSRSGEVKLFSIPEGNLVRAIKEPHSDTVSALEFSPDGQQLASCAADRFIKVWTVADGNFVRSFEGHTHHVLGVTWRADGRMLVSSGADNVIKVWDARTGDQLRTVQNQFTKEVTSVHFIGDSDLVLTSSGDARVRLVNASNGGIQRDFPGVADYMYATAVSDDGKSVLAGGLDGVLRVWNDQGAELAKFAPPEQPGQTAAK